MKQPITLRPERTITQSKLQQMFSRMLKVAMFDKDTLIGLKEDQKATGQAVAVLFLVSVSYGIGFTLFLGFQPGGDLSAYSIVGGVLYWVIAGMLAGLVWSFTVFLVGTRLFRGATSYWGLVRPLFYSTTPGVIFSFIAIPIRTVVFISTIIAAVWMVVAGVYAVRCSMGFSAQRSMLTYLVAFWGLTIVGLFFLR